MESSKGIIVVLSTVLILEASAFDSYENRIPAPPFSNFGISPPNLPNYGPGNNPIYGPPASLGYNYINNEKIVSNPASHFSNLNSYNGVGFNFNNQIPNLQYPNLGTTHTKQIQPLQSSANFFLNHGGISGPLITGPLRFPTNYNGLMKNVRKPFKITHIPVEIGSKTVTDISLPVSSDAKYQVMHLNPAKSVIKDALLKTDQRAEDKVGKAIGALDGYHTNLPNVANYQLETPANTYAITDEYVDDTKSTHIYNNYEATKTAAAGEALKKLPVSAGLNTVPNITLPIFGNSKYKVLHLNPSKPAMKDVLFKTIQRAEDNVEKAILTLDGFKQNVPNVDKISPSNVPVYDYAIQNEYDNRDNSMYITNKYGSGQTLNAGNELKEPEKAEIDLEKIEEGLRRNGQSLRQSTNTVPMQYKNVPLNIGKIYSPTTLLNSYPRYSNNEEVATSSYSHAAVSGSANSVSSKQDYFEFNEPNIGFKKDLQSAAYLAGTSSNISPPYTANNYYANQLNSYPLQPRNGVNLPNRQYNNKKPSDVRTVNKLPISESSDKYLLRNQPLGFGTEPDFIPYTPQLYNAQKFFANNATSLPIATAPASTGYKTGNDVSTSLATTATQSDTLQRTSDNYQPNAYDNSIWQFDGTTSTTENFNSERKVTIPPNYQLNEYNGKYVETQTSDSVITSGSSANAHVQTNSESKIVTSPNYQINSYDNWKYQRSQNNGGGFATGLTNNQVQLNSQSTVGTSTNYQPSAHDLKYQKMQYQPDLTSTENATSESKDLTYSQTYPSYHFDSLASASPQAQTKFNSKFVTSPNYQPSLNNSWNYGRNQKPYEVLATNPTAKVTSESETSSLSDTSYLNYQPDLTANTRVPSNSQSTVVTTNYHPNSYGSWKYPGNQKPDDFIATSYSISGISESKASSLTDEYAKFETDSTSIANAQAQSNSQSAVVTSTNYQPASYDDWKNLGTLKPDGSLISGITESSYLSSAEMYTKYQPDSSSTANAQAQLGSQNATVTSTNYQPATYDYLKYPGSQKPDGVIGSSIISKTESEISSFSDTNAKYQPDLMSTINAQNLSGSQSTIVTSSNDQSNSYDNLNYSESQKPDGVIATGSSSNSYHDRDSSITKFSSSLSDAQSQSSRYSPSSEYRENLSSNSATATATSPKMVTNSTVTDTVITDDTGYPDDSNSSTDSILSANTDGDSQIANDTKLSETKDTTTSTSFTSSDSKSINTKRHAHSYKRRPSALYSQFHNNDDSTLLPGDIKQSKNRHTSSSSLNSTSYSENTNTKLQTYNYQRHENIHYPQPNPNSAYYPRQRGFFMKNKGHQFNKYPSSDSPNNSSNEDKDPNEPSNKRNYPTYDDIPTPIINDDTEMYSPDNNLKNGTENTQRRLNPGSSDAAQSEASASFGSKTESDYYDYYWQINDSEVYNDGVQTQTHVNDGNNEDNDYKSSFDDNRLPTKVNGMIITASTANATSQTSDSQSASINQKYNHQYGLYGRGHPKFSQRLKYERKPPVGWDSIRPTTSRTNIPDISYDQSENDEQPFDNSWNDFAPSSIGNDVTQTKSSESMTQDKKYADSEYTVVDSKATAEATTQSDSTNDNQSPLKYQRRRLFNGGHRHRYPYKWRINVNQQNNQEQSTYSSVIRDDNYPTDEPINDQTVVPITTPLYRWKNAYQAGFLYNENTQTPTYDDTYFYTTPANVWHNVDQDNLSSITNTQTQSSNDATQVAYTTPVNGWNLLNQDEILINTDTQTEFPNDDANFAFTTPVYKWNYLNQDGNLYNKNTQAQSTTDGSYYPTESPTADSRVVFEKSEVSVEKNVSIVSTNAKHTSTKSSTSSQYSEIDNSQSEKIAKVNKTETKPNIEPRIDETKTVEEEYSTSDTVVEEEESSTNAEGFPVNKSGTFTESKSETSSSGFPYNTENKNSRTVNVVLKILGAIENLISAKCNEEQP